MMFKKGDKVTCVNAGEVHMCVAHNFIEGKDYEVLEDQDDYQNVYVKDEQGSRRGMYPQRFKLAPANPTLDLTKPIENGKGEKFTLLSKDGRGEYPVIGYVGNREQPGTYTIYGKYIADLDSNEDLRNVAEEFEGYFNVYRDDLGTVYLGSPSDTRREADQNCDGNERIGCVKLKLVEGQYDE